MVPELPSISRDARVPPVRGRRRCRWFADSPHRRYALAYTVGGYFNVLFEWLRWGAVDSPEEMAAAFASFTSN
jgi:hypothetical protein